MVLRGDLPMFCASPDGWNEKYVLEIKCPMSDRTMDNYLDKNGQPSSKYYSQVQLQMHMTGRKFAIFCVANPDFEKTNQIQIVDVMYNQKYVEEKIRKAKEFWNKFIWPKLFESVK